MTTGLSWCWAKVLDHHHHHHHFDCSRPLTGAPRACSDGQRSRRHGTHARMHTVACARRLRGASRGPHSRALELRCDEAAAAWKGGRAHLSLQAKKLHQRPQCVRLWCCRRFRHAGHPPSLISRSPSPVSSHRIAFRLASSLSWRRIVSSHVMCTYLLYVCSYSTHRTGSASIPEHDGGPPSPFLPARTLCH